jgi:hypothetical protein
MMDERNKSKFARASKPGLVFGLCMGAHLSSLGSFAALLLAAPRSEDAVSYVALSAFLFSVVGGIGIFVDGLRRRAVRQREPVLSEN